MSTIDTNLKQNQIKKSNLRTALIPVSIALAFGLAFVIKQVFFK